MSIVIDTFGSDFKQIVATEVVGFISVDVHPRTEATEMASSFCVEGHQLADLKEIGSDGPNLALEYGVKKCRRAPVLPL